MRGYLSRIVALIGTFAAVLLATPAQAQTIETNLTLTSLKTIFVTQQQYFALDNEQSTPSTAYNHLHITALDTATGLFTGAINTPLVPSLDVPQTVVPVTGRISPTSVGPSAVYPFGNYFAITFSWQYTPTQCENQNASYTGAMMFLGYDGSGKMHATIGGTLTNNYTACTLGSFTLGPVPFSGQMVK